MRAAALPLALLAAAAAAPAVPLPAEDPGVVAVLASRLHLADGRTLADAVVLVRGGRVAALGPNLPVPAGARVHRAPVACPGFADLRTGLPSGQDAEDPRPFGASLRVADGLEPLDPAAAAAAREGVLRRLLLPSDRVPLGGRAASLRPSGPESALEVLVADAGGAISVSGAAARRERHPASLAGLLRALEAAFHGVPGARGGPFEGADPALGLTEGDRAALASLAGGGAPAFLRARTRTEVGAALDLAGRLRLRPVLLEPACPGPGILEAAAAAGVAAADLSVVLAPGPGDPEWALAAPGILAKAGARVGFTAGGRGPDALRLAAALARSRGMEPAAARSALLGGGFPLLGRGPSGLDEGDPADLVLLDGDPEDPASRVLGVLSGGVRLGKAGAR